ncbi:MAG: HAD family hydrolase [Bacteroidetes bacterium]|nr:HAD family hydrolase [Bacteroidota bacterium]
MASTLGIAEVFSEQLPADKLNTLQQIMQSGRTVMVGDGINDAPALAKADIGISLSDASQIAMQSAQVILLKTIYHCYPRHFFRQAYFYYHQAKFILGILLQYRGDSHSSIWLAYPNMGCRHYGLERHRFDY